MTWKELAAKILNLTAEQMETDVTVFESGEFFPMGDLKIADEKIIELDSGHPFLA